MHIIKKTMVPAMLSLSVLGLTASLSVNATTLSDLQSQCFQACHDVTVSPSGWVLSMDAIGPVSGKAPSQKTVSGWSSTIAAMGDGKCGFTNVGPGGTSRSVAAQFMYDKQFVAAATPTSTTAPTPTSTTAPTPTSTTAPTPTSTTTAPTPTSTTAPTPTSTTTVPTPTSTTAPTPTSTTAPTPTSTSVPMHTWYDYDYKGGRCFSKDHTIMDRDWCEHHGRKGNGTHPELMGYDRHAHLDFPGQKP